MTGMFIKILRNFIKKGCCLGRRVRLFGGVGYKKELRGVRNSFVGDSYFS